MNSTTAPVLFHIFNRPKMVAAVMQQIRLARPGKLYISSDAPRSLRPEEAALCMECRKVVEQVDWDCEVITFFPKENSGTKYALIIAISWFFKHEPEKYAKNFCRPSKRGYVTIQLTTDSDVTGQINNKYPIIPL